MSQDVYIFEVSHTSFPSLVLENSHQLPVLATFVSISSGPCAAQEHLLGQLAREFAGQFILARIDVSEQPELRRQYRVEQVPTTVVFQNGAATHTELGQLDEQEARALLSELGIYRESDRLREQARERHLAGDTPAAIMLLTQAIRQEPGNLRVAMDMVQVFIDIGELDNARSLLARLPTSARESDTGLSLQGQLNVASYAANTEGLDALQQRLQADPQDLQARFDMVICLIAEHEYQVAMDQLLELIAQQPDFREGAARELMISILNTLKPNHPELAATYQRRFTSLLAS